MKRLVFPLLLILAIALTGCGSDSSTPKASDPKDSVPPAAPTQKIDNQQQQDSNSNLQKSSKKTSKYKVKKDLTDSGKPHQF